MDPSEENHMEIDSDDLVSEIPQLPVNVPSTLLSDASIQHPLLRLPIQVEPTIQKTSEKSPFIVKKHLASGKVYGRGTTFMDQFDSDYFSDARKHGCLYYPFASRQEWDLASFLLNSGLSMASINRFLKLELVSRYIFCDFIDILFLLFF